MVDAEQRGLEALEAHRWQEAFELLTDSDESGALSPAGLEALAEAAWWSARVDAGIAAYEKAFTAYLDTGQTRRAARVAMYLGREYGAQSKAAVASGWRARAERLLAEDTDCAEYGWLLLGKAERALAARLFAEAMDLSLRAAEIGVRHGNPDLTALARHKEAQVHLAEGRIEEGMALVDEATAAAVGGQVSARTTGLLYCWTIAACRDIADFSRASEWTDVATQWCERQSINGFPGVCRIHRSELLRLRGAIRRAEAEIMRACEELSHLPLMNGYAFAELGEVRLRLGDLAGAAEAFRTAHELGDLAEPGRSLLLLAEGRPAAALASIRRSLDEVVDNHFERARFLPAAVEIAIAADELEWAETAATALEDCAERLGSVAYRASAHQARAAVLLARSEPDAAGRLFRSAIRDWQEVDAPYEIARCRELLGTAFAAMGDPHAALAEFRASHSAVQRLGAARDARRMAARVATAEAGEAPAEAQRTFMFTDIVDSTALLAVIGDEAWTALLQWHDASLRELFQAHGGEEVDHAGDGFFVAFAASAEAIRCAIAIQRALREHRRRHGFAPRVRIGLHADGARRAAGSYKGQGVHRAARIGALAQPDEILASVGTLPGPPPVEAREVHLKGFSEPLLVCTVDWA